MEIRKIGDPVLRQKAAEIERVDDRMVRLTEQMFRTMYDEPGIGLAATQIGVEQRLFVYDLGDDPRVIVNPKIEESDGEWVYEEGCLSIPGIGLELVRPKEVLLTGYDLDGNEVSLEADELLARLFQHELDHLNGVLMIDHLEASERKKVLADLRELELERARQAPRPSAPSSGGLVLP